MKSDREEKRFRLPRRRVLKTQNEIKSLLNNASKRTGKYLNIFFRNSAEEKFAALVGRKAGKAVERNRMKRLVRELYRLHAEWFKGLIIIFYVKQVNISYTELEMEIKRLLSIP